MEKLGFRYSHNYYISLDLDRMEMIEETEEGINTYSIGEEGTGGFTADLRNFKSVMLVGETQQLNVTLTDGATAKYLSAAPSKFRVDENGLITAVGPGTASRLRIEVYDTKETKIGEILLGIAVNEE